MTKDVDDKKYIKPIDNKAFEKIALKVSKVSIVSNAVLTFVKLIIGILAHSTALISDAVHSASDVFSTIVVIIGVKLSAKESDADHQYGHERLESVAAIVLAIVLCVTGLFIGHNAIELLTSDKVHDIVSPGGIALIAALVSIISKEAMFWYTRHYAVKIDSSVLMADAWHHRSDAFSSIGSLIGIAGARMGFKICEPIASIVICMFILKAAYDIFCEAIRKLVDHACNQEIINEIVECALSVDGVIDTGEILTREFGNRIYVDLLIYADGDLTLRESDAIAERVHSSIENKIGKIKHIMVIVKPNDKK